jgi:hypothetical protein
MVKNSHAERSSKGRSKGLPSRKLLDFNAMKLVQTATPNNAVLEYQRCHVILPTRKPTRR